jgi:hypothetical protein
LYNKVEHTEDLLIEKHKVLHMATNPKLVAKIEAEEPSQRRAALEAP